MSACDGRDLVRWIGDRRGGGVGGTACTGAVPPDSVAVARSRDRARHRDRTSRVGWVSIDTPIQVISLLGVAFLLLLAGLEVDYEHLRGRLVRLTALGYTISFGLALLIGLVLHAGGLVKSPLLIGIVLSASSLGIVIPVLKDAGQLATPPRQLVVAGA